VNNAVLFAEEDGNLVIAKFVFVEFWDDACYPSWYWVILEPVSLLSRVGEDYVPSTI